MEFKTFSIRFGEYSKHPKDVEAKEILLPEDILFFTRGEHDIGDGKYNGALHYLCITKATDEELKENMPYLNPYVVSYSGSTNGNVRFNDYALITIHDCIIDTPIETIDEDTLNEILKPEEQYFVYLANDNNIIDILKINRILSESKILCCDVYLHGAINHKELNTIMCNVEYKLDNIINPFHRIIVKKVDQEYGRRLLTDAIYKNLSLVYPEFSEKRIGYDLNWLNSNAKEVFGYLSLKKVDELPDDIINLDEALDNLKKIETKLEELGTPIPMGYGPKEDVDYTEYKNILNFEKELPLEAR